MFLTADNADEGYEPTDEELDRLEAELDQGDLPDDFDEDAFERWLASMEGDLEVLGNEFGVYPRGDL